MKMKHIKKSLSLLLIVAMILSSISVLHADATIIKFTDINNSWARQNIINVYNKGLMNGVSESLFKPLDKVTNFQALISITRMTNAKEKYDLAALEAKYKDSVLDKYNVPTYARQETAYCLETGIVSANDISALTAGTYATKQVVSAYLAKAFGVTYDATKPIVFLGYNDSMFIIKENKAYIKYLIDIGVLSSQGDAKGNFNPDELITRETYAKMLDVASDKYKEVNPTIPAVPTTPTEPIPTDPTIPTEPTAPTIPTTPTEPTTPEVPANPAEPVVQPDYTGKVESVIIEYGVIVFQVQGANNTTTKKNLSVADDIICDIDGEVSSYYWKIKEGDKVFIYLNKEGKVSKLIVDSKMKKVTGTVESLLVTDKLELTIKIKDVGSRKYFITSETKIIKNKSSVKYDSLKAGDNVFMTVAGEDVLDINADSTTTTDSGVIESIMYTRTAAPKVTMIGLDGQQKQYFISKDIATGNILINDKDSYVYDLRPGMHVKVELENDEIIKLTTIRTETNNKMDGTIKYINKTFQIIVLSTYGADGKEETKEISVADSRITDVNLEDLTMDKLKEGDPVTVFAVTDAGKLKASLIILNN
jgi:hypothetical protein